MHQRVEILKLTEWLAKIEIKIITKFLTWCNMIKKKNRIPIRMECYRMEIKKLTRLLTYDSQQDGMWQDGKKKK